NYFRSRRQNVLWATILLISGLLIVYVSYIPFALEPDRWPPIPINHRQSGVHLGASVGYVLVWAGVFQITSGWSKRFGFVFSGLAFLMYSMVMGGFFLINQQMLVHNWSLQTVYWRQIEECLREAEPKLIIVDADDEEQRAGGAEKIFDWTTP